MTAFTKQIVLVGAGGFGRETIDVIDAINSVDVEPTFEVIGAVDDDPKSVNMDLLARRGVGYLGAIRRLPIDFPQARFVIGVGNPKVREEIAEFLSEFGMSAVTLVHPKSVIGSLSSLGPGTVICAGVQISTNVVLGEHVHVNPGAVVGHDAHLSSFVSVNPGAIISGNVAISRGSLVGAGAVILQGLTVGSRSVVGAGAVVVKNVEAGSTVKGVPAR
jgi:sugar O-acyltransferase (sialic acid O-acetyltransferase NeuD family)